MKKAIWFASVMIIAFSSQACLAQQRSGAWSLSHDEDAKEELGLKAAPRIASVRASNGRKSTLVLQECSKGRIKGRFDDDSVINVAKLPGANDAKKIYLSFDGVFAAPIDADGGYAPWYISIPMPPADAKTINLCPTSDVSASRCLRFSMEGFVKARQFLCSAK